MSLTVGVLAIQGDVQENISSTERAIKELGVVGSVVGVKTSEDISKLEKVVL